MKCQSVACIWPESPLSHRVTATAALDYPPTLYTGGIDGSIIWWNLCSSASLVEVKAVGMLCGHAAAISDLEICFPMLAPGENKQLSGGALISACLGGVLCVWSRNSGHCRRRRKLPPSAGAPAILRHLPSCPRYVCVGCYSRDASGVGLDGDSKQCCIVIVDTYSLSIVQTIFHGNLYFGTFKFMHVVLSGEDAENHSVLLVDSFGRTDLIPILKSECVGKERSIANHLHHDSLSEEAPWREILTQRREIISCAAHGNLVAFLFERNCVFMLLNGNKSVGQISFEGSLLCVEDGLHEVHVAGCMFSRDRDLCLTEGVLGDNYVVEKFCIWNNVGSSILYAISCSSNVFKWSALFEVPAFHPIVIENYVSFAHFNNYLVRINTSSYGEPRFWSPHISVWFLNENHETGKFKNCHHENHIPGDCNSRSCSVNKPEEDGHDAISFAKRSATSIGRIDAIYCSSEKINMVSSSMVISENHIVPYAVVYGYVNGEIEVIRFDMFLRSETPCGSPRVNLDTPVSRQYFLGHTGAIHCLAAHRMSQSSGASTLSRVLVSGSADCTVRIWNVDSGSLVTVMHQHVAPVRQLIFPPQTKPPWTDCFLSVGEDDCVALTSLETLRVERFLSGNEGYPEKVVWDGWRGYVACLCKRCSGFSDSIEVLYIWDVFSGARECILYGADAHTFLEHFCRGVNTNSSSGSVLRGSTSMSSLQLPIIENGNISESSTFIEKQSFSLNMDYNAASTSFFEIGKEMKFSVPCGTTQSFVPGDSYPVLCTCPFPGVAALSFDLASLMRTYQQPEVSLNNRQTSDRVLKEGAVSPRSQSVVRCSVSNAISDARIEAPDSLNSLEVVLLCFSLSFLHIWSLDSDLDKLLKTDMNVKRPKNCLVGSGMQGDKGSLTLTFPGLDPVLELWKSSPEFCAMRSLSMVSIAQRMMSMSSSWSVASSALAAFYTRNFIEKIPSLKPPSVQLLASFWQDESEHVRMAARTLFHCAASWTIPFPLSSKKADPHVKLVMRLTGMVESGNPEFKETSEMCMTSCTSYEAGADISIRNLERNEVIQSEESMILTWIESFELHDWISCVGGSSQDAMNSHIVVAAALAVWYPSLVKSSLPALIVQHLFKLVMAMNENWSSTAAELLAEGMENTWKACCSSDISHLIGDILFQIECVSNPPSRLEGHRPVIPTLTRDILVEVLLPSLAKVNVIGFLNVIESQIWSTASDSPIHIISLTTIVRVVRDSPRYLAPHLEKVVSYILHTMDLANVVIRKTCLRSSMTALKEIARTYPMVSFNESATRLAVGNAIGEPTKATISVYDMQSVTKIKVLDASGPLDLPSLLPRTSELPVTTLIAALDFSPDGEGVVAFSEHGLVIRWWTLGSVWWEKLSRNLVPVQCTKLIFVPPWEGFSPNTCRLSIISTMMGSDKQVDSQEQTQELSYEDRFNLLLHNLDLSYRLEWIGSRKVLLTTHGKELSTILL